MAQIAASEARLKLPELDTFLEQLRTRWSPEACSVLCTLEPGSNDSVARAIFDTELAALRRISRKVQHTARTIFAYVGTQRNKFCKINNLPAEILREIFLSACECGLRWRDLASILKTCKQWYHVLSRDPSAYSTINVGDRCCSLRLAKAFAKKSNPLPLNIAWADVGQGTVVSDSAWEAAFCKTRLPRIKSLEFVHWDLEADKWLLESPAPELERCKLSLLASDLEDEGGSDDESSSDYDPKEHILPRLFGGNTPKLRALDFHKLRLAWCPGNYSGLTHVKITFDLDTSGLLTKTGRDSDDVTILFRESPRLEHVELINHIDQSIWPRTHDVPDPDHTRPKCIMRHLHTLRLHLLKFSLILILGAIEITPTIKTIDIRSDDDDGSKNDRLEVLSIGVLPDFLFAKLECLSIGNLRAYDECKKASLVGSGFLHQHRYSFQVCLPQAEHTLLGKTVALGRRMPELRRIEVADECSGVLVELLAASPTADTIDIRGHDYVCPKMEDLRRRLLDPQSHNALSRVSHWAFIVGNNRYESTLFTDDIGALTPLFKHSPSRRRTFFTNGHIQLKNGGDLCAMRTFVVDLARLGVVIVEPVQFDLGWDYRYEDPGIYTSIAALWTSSGDEVPEVVQEVMK